MSFAAAVFGPDGGICAIRNGCPGACASGTTLDLAKGDFRHIIWRGVNTHCH